MKLGAFINSGMWRDVYRHPDNPAWVIKVLNPRREEQQTLLRGGMNPNRNEWEMWQRLKETPLAGHLCPCVSISDDSHYLVMVRAGEVDNERSDTLPPAVTALLDGGDLHMSGNWGVLDGRPVLIDYGNTK
jgi:hypothetical protein